MTALPRIDPNNKHCNGVTRSKTYCRRPAGWGTDHAGVGRCKLHGGKSGTLTHGMHSTVKSESLAKLVAEYEADPDPLNLRHELARIRALAHDYLDKHGADDFDFDAATKLLEAASRVVKRIEDIRSQNAISRADLLRVMGEMGRVVERHVEDDSTREKIRDAWLAIRL